MGLFNGKFPSLATGLLPPMLMSSSLRTKLMVMLLPPVMAIIIVTGYMAYQVSVDFLHIALGRNVRVQTLAMRHELEAYLADSRRDLLYLARQELNAETLTSFMADVSEAGGPHYREISLLTPRSGGHVFVIACNGSSQALSETDLQTIRPNPLLLFQDMEGWSPGQVRLSDIGEVEYPYPAEGASSQRMATHVVRLSTLVDRQGDQGILSLVLDATDLRNILSVYNSHLSPLWGFPRSDEVRYAYFFDADGWMLFQSEDPDKPREPLTTYLARSSFEGTLGRPGLSCAFRPSSTYGHFWKSVTDIALGKSDLLQPAGNESRKTVDTASYFFSYTPVVFDPGGGREPIIYGGVAFVDRSKLTLVAGYKYLDIMFIITLGSVLFIALILVVLGGYLTNPILRLARSVQNVRFSEGPQRIDVPSAGYETAHLKDAINHLIGVMERQVEEIGIKDEAIKRLALMERAPLDDSVATEEGHGEDVLPEITGSGPRVARLKSDILKAARTGVDVLIVGETGSGKQLTAEAIHKNSARRGKPFIAINCGALDENLLLDTLFGHVKGAFTEARNDRKGAFLEAHGGSLFLDEIQTASPKVQQSLLRAIEMRKVKPLGSDKEMDVDVRLITATNIDLSQAIEDGRFREDLYFRLRVICLQTPPLREHPESIPALAARFLMDARTVVDKPDLSLSRGALEKLRSHRWPGNIRELKNAITMAAVMAEGSVIQVDDIPLAGEVAPSSNGGPPSADPLAPTDVSAPDQGKVAASVEKAPSPDRTATPPAPPEGRKAPASAHGTGPRMPEGLNPRQAKAFPAIMEAGQVTRSEYEAMVGDDLPSRTAIYDLSDLVDRGLLRKTGRGPATRYVLADPVR